LDHHKNTMNLVRSGDNLVVRLHYLVRKNVRNPHFGFEIYTDLGALVTEVSTWSTGYEIFELTPGNGHIDLKISFLNLMPGRYYITLWSATVGKEDYDMLENCAALEIEPSDFYGTGLGVDSRFGVLFLKCNWELEQGKIPEATLA